MAYLTLRYHGGGCCGIAHIHGFGSDPERMEPAVNFTPGAELGATCTIYSGPRPVETTLERLDVLIAKCLTVAFHTGLIEVVLNSIQFPVWEEHLLSREFTQVNEFRNSNTGRTIRVYHLAAGQTPKPAVAKEVPLR